MSFNKLKFKQELINQTIVPEYMKNRFGDLYAECVGCERINDEALTTHECQNNLEK